MFANNSFFIPNFVEIQTKNFYKFLKQGILQELNSHNPIINNQLGLHLIFFPDYFQFSPPEGTMENAMVNGTTYACRLYVPAQFLNLKTGISYFQWILIGTLPIMNHRGHFLLNGSPRVIINQIVRSPGIYYAEALDRKGKKTIYADLISQRGTWLRFEMDSEGKPYLRMKRTPKIPVSLVLQAIGYNLNIITQRISKKEWFTMSNDFTYELESLNEFQTTEYKTFTVQEWSLVSLYALTHPKRELIEITPEMGKKFLFKKFLNPKTYDLGLLGRYRLNKRFNLSIPLDYRILTGEDILKITEYLTEVFDGNKSIDDIDHLKNRRIRGAGELIQNQFAIGLTRFEKVIRERLRRPGYTTSLANLITTKPINASLREFFGSSQLSQFLDQTNPLAEITHKRRFTSLGPAGVSRETAGMAIRSIHPTHYGRICPIETPEGQNAGLVNSPTTYTRLNQYGFLESPFYKIVKGQLQAKILYLTADQEEKLMIAPGDIARDKVQFLPNQLLPIRKGHDFSKIQSTDVNYVAISSLQMISVATSLIPFLEHDDANRALMGSNMQRQAVPILKPEKPTVSTGYEPRVVADTGHSLHSKLSGYVTYVSSQEIRILSCPSSTSTKFGLKKILEKNSCNNHQAKVTVPIQKDYLAKNKGENLPICTKKQKSRYLSSKFEIICYKLQTISRSNQDTYLLQRPIVQEGQWVEKGDILADGSASSGGELSLGKNILIGYVPWEGYNFEDAILISERLVQQDIYTSLHIEKYDMEIKDTRFGEEILTSEIPDISIHQRSLLDKQGIVKLGSWVREGDILVGKITPVNRKPLSPHERLLYDIVGKDVKNIKDTSLRVPKGLIARVVNIRVFDIDGKCSEKSINFKNQSFSQRKKVKSAISSPSKLISKKSLDNSKLNSEIENSLSFEKHYQTEKARKVVNNKTNGLSQKRIIRVQILLAEKRRVQVGDKMAGRHGNKGIISRILPQQDMPYLPDGTPLDMVLNPLGVPSRMNVGQVYECLLGLAGKYLKEHYKILPFDEIVGAQTSRSLVYEKLYKARCLTHNKWLFNPNFPGKIKLFDGRTGEPFDQRVTVGESYILKLIHQVDEKIHARSTGPYSLVTQQPLRGRSKHGGQRLGEMEVWALEGFGAAYTLQELLTVKSDDMKGRHQVMDAILTNVPLQLGTPESFKVLVRELQSLCLDIGVFAITQKGYRKRIDILRLP